MADEEINGDTDDIQHDKDKTQKKTAKHDSGVADLEKVTDYAEEMEISSQDISGALSLIGDRRNKEAAERLEKEQELQKVSVKKDDIELIVSKNLNEKYKQLLSHLVAFKICLWFEVYNYGEGTVYL
ncbi:huntingtin-interacting protein K isoform X1 [Bombyx mori]|uniref:huntingtin-interacting protein K isoform X1 n=1 Tax=Bombyx mori TaxID=7091 RepID=UPI002ED69B8E